VATSPRPPPSSASFNPKAFLAHAGLGKAQKKYRKNAVIFTQGEVAGTVFYIQKGKVKVTVLSEQGKEPAVGRI
jgi:CRP-like cAMP-binding protein